MIRGLRKEKSEVTDSIIAVVLVNWNGWRDTLAAYRSLLNTSVDTSWKLIIVDNASSDQSVVELSGLPDVELIASKRNVGFAGGVNLGLERARAQNAKYVFLLNNDAEVESTTLKALLDASSKLNDQAVLGSVVRFKHDQSLQFFGSENGRIDESGKPSGRPAWYNTSHKRLLSLPLIESDFIFGAALFSPIDLFKTIGLFDERFFLTYEETDWCYRARKAGHRCYVVTDSVVHHAGSASLGAADGPLQSYFLLRNRFLFFERHATLKQRYRIYKEFFRTIRWERSRSRSKALLLGFLDYHRRKFGDCPNYIRALQTRSKDASTADEV